MAAWLLVGVALAASSHAASASGGGGCEFPRQWSGRWFQSGVPQLITLNSSYFETKGACIESDGDKFITEDKWDNCYRCVVIHEKHPNVLQYKETYCESRASLGTLCDQITGDATLYSMFRAEPLAQPAPCPFRGPPFTFTYSRGAGDCRSPVSRIDACADDSRLLLRYQACPDVAGTESTVEELVCLASWKEGNTRYLVGRLLHKTATSDEDRYRCFVYAKAQRDGRPGYDVAQSGDATCSGLLSPNEGSRTMRLSKAEGARALCRFPAWLTDHHNWYSLDARRSYHFSHKNATLRVSDGSSRDVRVVCHAQRQPADAQRAVLVAHITNGCNSGYVCMVFYKRDGHVIELQQTSQLVQAPEEACNGDMSSLPFTTLVTATLHPRKCPLTGRFTVVASGPMPSSALRERVRRQEGSVTGAGDEADCPEGQQGAALEVGCGATADTLHFRPACGAGEHLNDHGEYMCHGSWEDNGTSFLIASPVSRKSGAARRHCFAYRRADSPSQPSGSGVKRRGNGAGPEAISGVGLVLSSVSDSCWRDVVPGISGEAFYNLTLHGQCASAPTDGGAQLQCQTLPAVLILTTAAAALALR